MRGWSAAEVARYYNVSQGTVHRHGYYKTTPPQYPQPKPLYTGRHYMELCWFKLYLNEGINRRQEAGAGISN